VARTVLRVGAVAWILLAICGFGVAAMGRNALLAVLPPLAIDADALGGAVAVMAVAFLAIGVAHSGIAIGLGRGLRWAQSAGVLLASVLAVAFLGLAAAAVASAVRESPAAPTLVGAAAVAVAAAIGYGLTAARLVGDLRSGSAI
jgi:hypothetical protein